MNNPSVFSLNVENQLDLFWINLIGFQPCNHEFIMNGRRKQVARRALHFGHCATCVKWPFRTACVAPRGPESVSV